MSAAAVNDHSRGRKIVSSGLALALGLAAALLLAGLAVDQGLTRSQLQTYKHLEGKRLEQTQKLAEIQGARAEANGLARYYGSDDLDTAFRELHRIEPLTFLNQQIDAVGLRRQELGTDSVSKTGELRRTRLGLRVYGSYGKIVKFVRNLESGSRLVLIDEFLLQPVPDSGLLEVRLNISVFDPIMDGGNGP
jgi:hypothetical protein